MRVQLTAFSVFIVLFVVGHRQTSSCAVGAVTLNVFFQIKIYSAEKIGRLAVVSFVGVSAWTRVRNEK
jgi:hypothetical protein